MAKERDLPRARAVFGVLVAGALFGAGTPLAKGLLDREYPPLALAGTFYFVAGVELLAVRWFLRSRGRWRELPLGKPDFPWLLGAILTGGAAGPAFLLYGLRLAPAFVTSLLVNLEAVFTALLAILFFGDRPSSRELIAMATIVLAAAAVGFDPGGEWTGSRGVAGAGLVALAALAWGLDNNFSERISKKDPIQIVGVKGLVAGSANLVLAATLLEELPFKEPALLAAASLVGLLSYGASIALFVLGLRHLGPTRTVGLFATAPLWGMGLSWGLLGENPGPWALVGGAVVVAGVPFLILAGQKRAKGPGTAR